MLRGGEWRADRHRLEELGQLLAREHRLDAFDRFRGARVDRLDAAVGDVTSLEGDMQQPGDLHIVDVGGPALNQPRILAPLDARADQFRKSGGGRHQRAPAFCPAFLSAEAAEAAKVEAGPPDGTYPPFGGPSFAAC